MSVSLYDYQLDAIKKMKNGCILCGGVGSGKSRTAIAYFCTQEGGKFDISKASQKTVLYNNREIISYTFPGIKINNPPRDLYIITTARKRDTFEWEGELIPFRIYYHEKDRIYKHNVVIDSWNNISKYVTANNAFFIFDEQRVIGKGEWVKSFIKISKANSWILLSATPGDTWLDYIPVFIANGFYKNRSQFNEEHIVWSYNCKFPKVQRYLNTGRLVKCRNEVLVEMDYERNTVSHHEDVYVQYNIEQYKDIIRSRWNMWENKPLANAAELCFSLRKVVNSDESRQVAVLEIVEDHPKVIIFYNYDYELEILKGLGYGPDTKVAEWNGHRHEEIPEGDSWVYLVQYAAGAEGWNCIRTNTIIFYSQSYSYKVMVQASGRIDRLNTPFPELFYYHLKSRSGIDLEISRALRNKQRFNEGKFAKW